MSDWRARFRALLRITTTPEAERHDVERVLQAQRDRLALIDLGLPQDRRRRVVAVHPMRRRDDAK